MKFKNYLESEKCDTWFDSKKALFHPKLLKQDWHHYHWEA